MIKQYLFVGGKADGHMIEVDSRYNHWEIPVIDGGGFETPFQDGCGEFQVTFEKEIYRKISWRSGDNVDFGFFALDKLGNEEVMRMVLDNYKPKQDIELDKRVKIMKNMLERCVSMFENSLKWIVDLKQAKKMWDLQFELLKFLNKN